MQTQFLRIYAPNSLHLLYHPTDTGSPSHDMSEHISRHSAHRIDIESTQLIGDRVIGRVEHDLGPANEAELQHRILTVPYAEKQLGSNADAVEFVRVIKEAVSAGADPDPRSFQVYASWAYGEIKRRLAEYNSATHDVSVSEYKAQVISSVLSEIAKMAMQLTAITATKEDRLLDEPEVYEFFGSPHYSDELNPNQRRELFELRCEQILDKRDTTDPFTAELRSICSKLSRAHSTGNVYDEESQFQSYLRDQADAGASEENLEALVDSHERITEQYSEGGVVSLHMSDGERFIVDGTLDEDVDETYLPHETADLVPEIRNLFTDGEDTQTIGNYIDFRLNQIYGDPADKDSRIFRTTRAMTSTRKGLVEYTYRVSVYPNREERQYVREVLEQILDNMHRDFMLRSMNRSVAFRSFIRRIEAATETRALIDTIQDAYQARLKGTISIKMFTALNTAYEVKRANLDSSPLRETKDVDGRARTFIVATPVIKLARTLPTRELRTLATAIQTLPIQERERVRNILRTERHDLYVRIQEGLLQMINQASARKLMYLRFAFYEDRKTGIPNEPHNMIHLLTAADKAAIWESLKNASGLAKPMAA
jgi:hypothetical protein